MELISHEEVIQQALKDPEFNKEYKKMSYNTQISKFIYMVRLSQKLTQKEFAKKYKIQLSKLREMEFGDCGKVTLNILEELLGKLGLYMSIKIKDFSEDLED